MHTFSIRFHQLCARFYKLVEMNLMHEKIVYTLEIMEWKTFFKGCGFDDLYAEQCAKLFQENRY